MASSSTTQGKIFNGPGLSLFKRIITIIGVLAVTSLVLWIAIHQGASAIGSTIVAILFIVGFIIYLRIIAPVPFTIEIEPEALIKRSKSGEVVTVGWERMTRVKEEFFPNGKRISITVYRKPAHPAEKTKAWAVYRDDVTDIDGLAATLRQTVPETCEWKSETVHS
jgi:uncharacterized membrane protein YciS (DUF1049 family)